MGEWRSLFGIILDKKIFTFEHLIYSAAGQRKFEEVGILQNELLKDNALRFVAINIVLKLVETSNVIGLDGKKSLSYKERLELQESLKLQWFNWKPQGFKTIAMLDIFKRPKLCRIFTLSDRVWHMTLSILLHPAQQALFHPMSIGYREGYSDDDILPSFLVNITKVSGGFNKRVLTVELPSAFPNYNLEYLMSKIIGGRKIKQSILIALKSGLIPQFMNETLSLSSLLANILLNNIEDIHPCIRFGNNIAFFLNPSDSETIIIENLRIFLFKVGLNFSHINIQLKSLSSPGGVDFCGWNFYLPPAGQLIASPAFNEYQIFAKSIKTIINNSNYGAVRI
jgi:RNA-directed DNA polymerase